ncbi:MAG: response regulator [Planctomycetota bacterium]|nr:response regulator [Planctomycetota bacterium]
MQIVILEDVKESGPILGKLLTDLGQQVRQVATSDELKRILNAEAVPMLFVDVRAAGGNLIPLCRDLRLRPWGEDTFVVAVLPREEIAMAGEAIAAGADDYIVLEYGVENTRTRMKIALRRAEGRAERATLKLSLRESEDRYWSLIESSPDAIEIFGLDHRMILGNRQAARMHGFKSTAEMTGADMQSFVAPEDWERVEHAMHQARQSEEAQHLELTLLRREGGRFPADLSISSVRGADGQPRALIQIVREATARKRLEEQLRTSQKMEAIGQLAGGIAHDFNNLLTSITGYSQLVLTRMEDRDPNRSNIQQVVKAADRAANLTRQLLAFGRRQLLQPKIMDLNAVVRDMERLLRPLIPENIAVRLDLQSGVGRVKADPGQIEQVIMNLAVNARDAMPNGGTVLFETRNMDLDEAYAMRHIGVKPGRYVQLAVTDTGTGMPPEVLGHIFEPFYTTKPKGRGTGLGLSTVYGIVKQSGGNVWAYSEPGHGTVFKVYLPRVDDQPVQAETPTTMIRFVRGTETVLLAEDENEVRGLISEVLRFNGYRVLEARNGKEALQVARAFKENIHLLVSDVVMPEMGGRDLALALMPERRHMKVLFVSGYTETGATAQFMLPAGTAFLQKPFTPERLARKVRKVLDLANLPNVTKD